MDFEKELSFVRELMGKAGKILLANYENPSGIKTKDGDGTLVTDADKKVSELISSAFEKYFPDDGILDEERKEDETRFNRQRCWLVDPLDGTREYVAKTGDFGIIIGLLDDFQPVFGATYKPQKDEFVYAIREQGAYLIQGSRATRLKTSDSDEIHVLISRIRTSEDLTAMLRRLNPDSVTYMGGSLKTIEVAKGNATLFLCPATSNMSWWDICGPSVILEEAGGVISDIYGNPFDYHIRNPTNYNGVIATNRCIYDTVLEKIR